ncbi:MAG: sel1 repeat family protein [Simkaniaceae bacterium]|nr:MAG: sel1 repeat family protein [Simkaniaceae bacterium]
MESIQSRTHLALVSSSPAIDLNMETIGEEIDIYSQSSLQELQDQSFANDLDLYICVVREGENAYFFEASGFMENCIKDHAVIKNPFTRRTIENFEIYVSSEKHPDFQLYMRMEEFTKTPNHLPVHWNDHSLSKSDRLGLMMRYAKHFESTDMEKAIETYEMAAEKGSTAAKLRLATLYSERKERDLAIKWLCQSVIAEDITTSNVYACARNLGKFQAPKSALVAYTILADRGNQYGIGAVIRHYELGVGVEKDPLEAEKWRGKLPDAWKNRSITDFFIHLQAIKYGFGNTGYP